MFSNFLVFRFRIKTIYTSILDHVLCGHSGFLRWLCRYLLPIERLLKMMNIYVKVLFGSALTFAALQVFHLIFSNSHYMRGQASLESFRAGSWSCELDKQLVLHLRKEIKDKEKLLKYREKVINTLRKTVLRLNRTTENETGPLPLPQVKSVIRKRSFSKNDENRNMSEHDSKMSIKEKGVKQDKSYTPFPDKLDEVARNGTKPCCMALKRMSDILRQYIDTIRDLKHQVAIYEQTNVTAKLLRYGEIVKRQTIAKNCSTYFIPKRVEKQKDELFLSSDLHSIFEAQPLYMEPKQKIGNFGAKHRNIDLKTAWSWAVKELKKYSKDKSEKTLEPLDILFNGDPLKGNQYIFTARTKSGKVFTVPVLRPLGPYISDGKIMEQTARLKELINIIVPLSGRSHSLEKFLHMFHEVCTKNKENIFLTIVIYGNSTTAAKLKHTINEFAKKSHIIGYDIMRQDLPFSRGRALDDGVNRWNGKRNVLMFFCDIDVTFDRNFLRRCRANTRAGKQVYYPILFSQYNPQISKKSKTDKHTVEVDSESGTWRPLGFGMTCIYRADYLKVGGFNLKIKGWGGEDNDLFNR